MSLETIDRLESNVRGYVRSFPTEFDVARGAWLTDTQGRRYLDFFAGAGTLNYGHNPPRVNAAIIDYLQSGGVTHGLDMATRAKTGFLEALEEIILKPRGLDFKIQFTGPTGTNAVEAAIKLARKTKQRSHVVAFTNAYHGHSLGSLALTGNRYYHDLSYGSHNNVTHLPYDGYMGDYDTTELLEKMLCDGSSGLPLPAAVIVETVQGEGGVNVASAAWLRRLRDVCSSHDVLLIIDDIQVGNGRTGRFFSFEFSGIKPDIVCLSKAIGGGLPLALVLMRPELDCWQPGEHTGTFRGNNLAFVAAKTLLELWRGDEFTRDVEAKSNIIHSALADIAAEWSHLQIKVRGRGMIWGIDLGPNQWAREVCQEAFRRGLLVETSGARDHVIKLLPPLVIAESDLRLGLGILRDSLSHVAAQSTHAVSLLPQAMAPTTTQLLEGGSPAWI